MEREAERQVKGEGERESREVVGGSQSKNERWKKEKQRRKKIIIRKESEPHGIIKYYIFYNW